MVEISVSQNYCIFTQTSWQDYYSYYIQRFVIIFSCRVNDLVTKLDPEGLGIILKKDFLQFFYPEEMAKHTTEVISFQLIHYNGLEHSNTDGRVSYFNYSLLMKSFE